MSRTLVCHVPGLGIQSGRKPATGENGRSQKEKPSPNQKPGEGKEGCSVGRKEGKPKRHHLGVVAFIKFAFRCPKRHSVVYQVLDIGSKLGPPWQVSSDQPPFIFAQFNCLHVPFSYSEYREAKSVLSDKPTPNEFHFTIGNAVAILHWNPAGVDRIPIGCSENPPDAPKPFRGLQCGFKAGFAVFHCLLLATSPEVLASLFDIALVQPLEYDLPISVEVNPAAKNGVVLGGGANRKMRVNARKGNEDHFLSSWSNGVLRCIHFDFLLTSLLGHFIFSINLRIVSMFPFTNSAKEDGTLTGTVGSWDLGRPAPSLAPPHGLRFLGIYLPSHPFDVVSSLKSSRPSSRDSSASYAMLWIERLALSSMMRYQASFCSSTEKDLGDSDTRIACSSVITFSCPYGLTRLSHSFQENCIESSPTPANSLCPDSNDSVPNTNDQFIRQLNGCALTLK